MMMMMMMMMMSSVVCAIDADRRVPLDLATTRLSAVYSVCEVA